MKTVCISVCLALGLSTGWLATGIHRSYAQADPNTALAYKLLELINQDRSNAGVRPLHLGRRLSAVAEGHTADMAEQKYFAHRSPGGLTPFDRMRRARIAFHLAGENLGYASGYSPAQALEIIDVMMLESPEHRANLLQPRFSHVGIGITEVGNKTYVTEDFTG